MNTKLSQDYITLELQKVLEMLAQEAANEKTKELARALTPDSDPARVRYALQQTEDAFQLSVRFGSPSFDSFTDVCAAVRRPRLPEGAAGDRKAAAADLVAGGLVFPLRSGADCPLRPL